MSSIITTPGFTEPTNPDIFFYDKVKFKKGKKGLLFMIQCRNPGVLRKKTSEEDLFETYSDIFSEEKAILDLKPLSKKYFAKISKPQNKDCCIVMSFVCFLVKII